MPDDVSSLREFNDKLADFSSNVEAIHKHSLSAGLSFKSLITSVFLGENALKAWDAVITRSTWAKGVDTALRTLKADSNALLANRAELRHQEELFASAAERRLKIEGVSTEQAVLRLALVRDQLNVLDKQMVLDRVTRSTHPAALAFYATIVSSVSQLYANHQQIGKTLVAANSSMHERLSLTRAILDVQLKLGSDQHTNLEASKALVDYGFKAGDAFQRNLELVVKMHDGLGMTLRTGAELAAVYENQLGTSADGVADSIARVVNDTALAADEAGRLATNLGRAVALLRPGIAKDMTGVLDVVGRYEGALQKMGGQFGSFEKLVTKLTTPEGLMQAGLLGVANPEFAASGEGVQQVIDSFVDYAKNTIGTSSGWDRALRLGVLAEQFGTTTQQVNEMILAYDAANLQQRTALTLQERYDEQMESSMQTFQRLRSSLSALLQEAAIPLLKFLAPVAGAIAKMLESIIKIPGAVHAVSVAFVGASVFMVKRLIDVSIAFYQVAAGAHIAAMRLRAQAMAEAAAGAGVAGPGRAAGAVAQYLPRIAGALFRWLPILGAGAYAASLMQKFAQPINWTPAVVRESFESVLRRTLYLNARRGDMGAINNSIERMRDYYKNAGLKPAALEKKIADTIGTLPEFIGRARFVKEAGVMTVGPSTEDSAQIERLIYAQKETAIIAKQHHEAALKLLEVDKTRNREEAERNADYIRSQRLNGSWFRPFDFGGPSPVRNAWDYYFGGSK